MESCNHVCEGSVGGQERSSHEEAMIVSGSDS